MNTLNEQQDQALFNEISARYARKDIYPPSSLARRTQTDLLMDLIQRHHGRNRFERILEIGCGHGANAEYLRPYYREYLGLDYSEELIGIAKQRYSGYGRIFTCSNVKEFDRYHEFDLIMGIGVLHHITDLAKTLADLNKKCNQGTVLAFIEPQNGNPFIQLMRRIRKSVDRHYSEDQVFFSKKEITAYFAGAGFRVDRITFSGYFSVPFAQVMLKPRWIFMPLAKWMTWLDKRLSKFDSRLAWNIMAVLSSDKNRIAED